MVPKGTPRPRSGKNGVFYVKGASDNKKIFKEFIRDNDITLISTPTLPISGATTRKIRLSTTTRRTARKSYCSEIRSPVHYSHFLR